MQPVNKRPKLIKIYFLLKYKNLKKKKKKKIRTISKDFSLSKWIIWSLCDVGKQIFFKGCKENFQQIVGWKVKLHSRAGRLPLIKSILISMTLSFYTPMLASMFRNLFVQYCNIQPMYLCDFLSFYLSHVSYN